MHLQISNKGKSPIHAGLEIKENTRHILKALKNM
jgi:hypothetical protein